MRAHAYRAALAAAVGLGVLATGVPAAADDTRTVEYSGYRTTVPASWPVYDLTREPDRCVRYDTHAVYLGRPGADQDCPARAIGRTEALLVEPLDDASRTRLSGLASGVRDEAGALWATFDDDGVAVTASYGTDPDMARGFVAGGTAVRPVGGGGPSSSDGVRPLAPNATGLGFETCAAPSRRAMSAWQASPYRTVGIYIGGMNSACSQPNLSADWVRAVHDAGYTFIPTYVGRQAPCGNVGTRIDPTHAAEQGVSAARDAVMMMRGLGFGTGNPVYFDMEAYPIGGSCGAAVLTFLTGWAEGLRDAGYRSGVYSSAGSGIRELARHVTSSRYRMPDAIWFAHWDGDQSVTGDPNVPDSLWADHQRIKQYRGGHRVSHGGVSMNIDSDSLDGPVAVG